MLRRSIVTFIAVLLSIILLFTSVAFAGNSTSELIIGTGLALTGGSAEQGNRARRGALLAIEEANATGGINGRMIKLLPLDDRGDPKEAANVASRLASEKNVMAVIGHTNSSCTLAGAPIYNRNRLVQITCSSSSPKISNAGKYTFRVWNSDVYTIAFNMKQILDKGFKKVAIIYENNDYGRGGFEVGEKILKEHNIVPVLTEAYLLGETKDFNTLITKMKNAGVEAVLGVSDETEIPLFMKQAHQQGYNPFFVSPGTYNPAVIKLGGKDVEGVRGSAFFDPANPPEKVARFFDKFLKRFGPEGVTGTDPISPAAYDATCMVIEALRKKGTTREDVREYLAALRDFDGVSGTLSFDENGDMKLPLVRMTIENGTFREIK